MKIEFFMVMEPPTCTHQEKQVRFVNGKPVFYEPPELKRARQKLVDHLAKYKPLEQMQGPLELVTTWCFPAGSHPDGAYRTSRPDTDNLQKMLKDCMTTVGFWEDDAQVAREISEKFWAKVPGIRIRVAELTG